MNCFYINLEKDKEKRKNIEALFGQYAPKGWQLIRFNAIDKEYVEKNNILGTISSGAKGCYLSHLALISKNIDTDKPLFVIEDDVIFSKSTFIAIEKIISSVDTNLNWDIIHTDICVPSPGAMIDFYIHKKKMNSDQLTLVDLSDKTYASTTGYIVNPKSLKKLEKLLAEPIHFNLPIDIYLRTLTHSRLLRSFVVFPFITSLSNKSTNSNIQIDEHAYTELIWHTFRKMIWIEPNAREISECIDKIKKSELQSDASILLDIVSGFFREKYIEK